MKNLEKNLSPITPNVLRKVTVVTLCMFLLLGSIVFITIACDKEKSNGNLQHVRTELGGCNKGYDINVDVANMENDTVIITVSKDTINVFVNLPYSCKLAPFETQVEIIDNIIYMHIIDKCWLYDGIGDDCYSRCMCNYTFDFVFTTHKEFNQKYKIILTDPRKEEPIIVAEGILNNSSNNKIN